MGFKSSDISGNKEKPNTVYVVYFTFTKKLRRTGRFIMLINGVHFITEFYGYFAIPYKEHKNLRIFL